MPDIPKSRIAILATDGYERSELREPLQALRDKGASVSVVSIQEGEIRSWDETDWGDSVAVDAVVKSVTVEDFDALILPGGQINPDKLRTDEDAVAFVRGFAESGKPVAAICHGPWLLAEADLLRGRQVTSFPSIRTDLMNAGGEWRDEEVVVDRNLITSRNPGDIPAFIDRIERAVREIESDVGHEKP